MLTNLHVKNLALIKESEVEFTPGLNILTGETGAGKSIIIGSIAYALGAKAESDLIREGEDHALIELVFHVDKPQQRKAIEEMDFPIEEDGTIILTKKITAGRNVLKVCGETITAKQAKELATVLIDVHGQHEHQSLLQPKKQKEILDGFAQEELAQRKEKLSGMYRQYCEMVQERATLAMDDARREREIAMARFEFEEIENAGLTIGEDVELEKQYKKMQNGQKISDALDRVSAILGQEENGAINGVGEALYELTQAAELDEELICLKDQLADAESVLHDAYHAMENYRENYLFDQKTFDEVTERLNLVNHLMNKYGHSVEDVLAYGEKRRQELEKLEDLVSYLEQLNARIANLENEIRQLCGEIHEIRTRHSKDLSREIKTILEDMNFLKVSFEIAVIEKEEFGSDGFDDVVFQISMNPGERMKPIAEVASGGELSRIMLALKAVFAKKDDIDTLIFDEIDAGISGRTAWKVSEVMGRLAKTNQIICITHLPQIAAMADTHFMIEKAQVGTMTTTDIYALDRDQSVEEVARLLGSDTITDAVRTNAKELIAKAQEIKKG
ncbi:MAG: DNA repair protein RecN [Lachnospiraceae bacterium]